MWKRFSQPYPCLSNSKRRTAIAFGLALLTFLLLQIFKPFGLRSLPAGELTYLLTSYALLCLTVLLIDLFLIPKLFARFFDDEKWTVGKEIAFVLWNYITVSLGLIFFTQAHSQGVLLLDGLVDFLFWFLLITCVPVILFIKIRQMRMLKQNLNEAREMTAHMNRKRRLNLHEEAMVSFRGPNSQQPFTLHAIDLLFVTGAQSGIHIHYMDNREEKCYALAAELKTAREDLRQHTAFYRCHRNWIVNLDRVRKVSGNAQGYRLLLEGSDTEVPVSRMLNRELTLRIAG